MATHPAVYTLPLPGKDSLPFVLACYVACYVDACLSRIKQLEALV